MTDALRRGTRTFLDVAFVTAIVQALVEFGVDLTADQRAILVTLGTYATSAVKNALEDNGTIPALLKAPASEGENPVPDPEGGAVDQPMVNTLCLLVIAAVAVLHAFGKLPL